MINEPTMNQQCIICGNRKFKSILKISNAPSSVGKLLNRNQTEIDKKMSLILIVCTKCKLCQLEKSNRVEQNYYDNYQMGVSFSNQMQNYQKWLAQDFIGYFSLKDKFAFEIGCGDGMFASFLNKQGLRTIGIEPSKPFYVLAKRKTEVLNQYLDKSTSLKKKYYDAFVVRQVFEHLGNPNQILGNTKLFLKPDGVGLIEVPSFLTAIKDNRYYDIFRDHLVYYTKYTLQYLLTINNFQTIKIFHSANSEYLTAYFKNNEYHDKELKLFSLGYANYKKSIKRMFSLYKNRKVAVWGTGGKGIALLSMCDIRPEDVLFAIDSDPHKWNKYTPGSHILVKPPGEVDFSSLDLIIISAVMYQAEIIKDLRVKYKYKNKIGVIASKPRII